MRDEDVLLEEGRVIGSVVNHPNILDEIAFLHPDNFISSQMGSVYEVMRQLRDEGRTYDVGILAAHSGVSEAIISSWRETVERDSVVEHARIVQRNSICRSYVLTGAEIYEEASNWTGTASEIHSWVQDRINSIQTSGEELVTVSEVADDIIPDLSTPNRSGISRGYPNMDRVLGLSEGQMVEIIAGLPHAGKTRLALNIALNLARNSKSVLYAPLEEGPDGVVYKLLHMITTDRTGQAVPVSVIRSREWRNDEDQTRVADALEELRILPIKFVKNLATSAQELHAACRVATRSPEGLDAVFLDYIQLMGDDSTETNNRNMEISNISRGIKLTARALGLRFFVLSQLSRKVVSRQDRLNYMISDLRDSGSLEQDADNIMFVHSERSLTNPRGAYPVKVLVRKNRVTGELGDIELHGMDYTTNGNYGSYLLYDNFTERIA